MLLGAKIIVLPECALTGYLSQDLKTNWHVPEKPLHQCVVLDVAIFHFFRRFVGLDPSSIAQTVPGPITKIFCSVARKMGCYITVPFVEVVHPKANPSAGTIKSKKVFYFSFTNPY